MAGSLAWSLHRLHGVCTIYFTECLYVYWESADTVSFCFLPRYPSMQRTMVKKNSEKRRQISYNFNFIPFFLPSLTSPSYQPNASTFGNVQFLIRSTCPIISISQIFYCKSAAMWTRQPHCVAFCRILRPDILTIFRMKSCQTTNSWAAILGQNANVRSNKACLLFTCAYIFTDFIPWNFI